MAQLAYLRSSGKKLKHKPINTDSNCSSPVQSRREAGEYKKSQRGAKTTSQIRTPKKSDDCSLNPRNAIIERLTAKL